MFLLIDLQKAKIYPKLNILASGICSDIRILTKFRQVVVHYLMSILKKCKSAGGKIFKDSFRRRKYMRWSLLLIKLQDWWCATLLKKRPQRRCFPMKNIKYLRKAYFMEPFWGLLLKMFEEFLRISKGDLTWNGLYDSTNLKF